VDELLKLKEYQDNQHLDPVEVGTKYTRFFVEVGVDRARKFMRSLDTVLGSIEGAIKARREGANRNRGVTCRRAGGSFVEGMHRRGYGGDGGRLKIDHAHELLELKVPEYSYSKVRSFSGYEEKLLLALWDVMDCPLFGFDEFDVCLEAVNRSAAVAYLVQETMLKSNRR
jgi:hypothetical protein